MLDDVTGLCPKISLEELIKDIGAFLFFLRENYSEDGETPSFWMLIPQALDVKFQEGVKNFYLQKELFSRKIWIIAEPPPQDAGEIKRQQRRAELITMFSGVLASDQFSQLTTMLSQLDSNSRERLLDNFKKYQAEKKL